METWIAGEVACDYSLLTPVPCKWSRPLKTAFPEQERLGAAQRAALDQTMERLREAGPEVIAACEAAGCVGDLQRVLAASEFAGKVACRLPDPVAGLVREGRLRAGAGVVVDAAQAAPDDDAAFERRLRHLRDRELFAITWRDLTGIADTRKTMRDLSTLAEALIGLACEHASAAARIDAPPVILGMGKLGGHELNFSSDVDLIFLHAGDDPTPYLRIAKRVIALLERRTGDGFVYRVDTRLRPFGATGALSLSIGAFESYLQSHGRDWERYAYVKARPITGGDADRARVESMLRAYVYRRYLDYGVFESLRDTKGMIEADVAKRRSEGDIKRGRGGIREVEFVVQALQLIRGGRQRQLQTTGLHEALAALVSLGWLDAATASALEAAYDFLRHCENRLQMWRDAQTHRLPTGDIDRERLALAMGFDDWPACEAALEGHREAVAAAFTDLLGLPDAADETPSPAARLWRGELGQDETGALLAEAGVRDVSALEATLERLRQARFIARLDAIGLKRLDRLMPALIEQAALCADGAVVFGRVADVVEGVGRRSAYFSLLNENPAALERLVDLCRESEGIARRVAVNPLLLDSLIDPRIADLPAHSERSAQLHAALHGGVRDDLELLIDALSQFKSTAVFEVAVADLASNLPVMKVSDQLTWIAQSLLEEVLISARRDLERKYGVPQPSHSAEAAFCVVAYGKLGGLELGYGSDLDLVFLYDCGDEDPPTSGPRVVASSVYFARLVQRIVHIASATTRFGSLYDIDMRLRPSGNSGPLVSSLVAFERYQRERAWTWEHQALLRARAVAGDQALCDRFDSLRRDILCTVRDEAELAQEVVNMRARMRKALHKPRPGQFDLKHGPGGLTDVEFLIQFWLLAHAHREPALVSYSDHMRQLDALVDCAVVPEEIGREVQRIYLAYRTRLHHKTLRGTGRWIGAEDLAVEREQVRGRWQQAFAATRAPD